ncbi:DNA polymerase IV [Pontibacter sp. JAM-7]|uniref:DNA polymerase IV n=1 Tax=Pontibacter sp. JAM-7 TaxID=3366581 RepID=UPI003AF91522
MATQRKIIHIDCDCFFAAVEMRDNPALAQIPLAIGGSVDRRGVIATCNYPARRFGIHSAMATAQAIRLCPDLHLLPTDMQKYRLASAQVMQILTGFSDLIEQISIDEAYLDVTGSNHFQGSATRIAAEIKAEVFRQVGIRVSAGVAPNRFLAKIASDWQKPDGLFVIRPEQIAPFVAALPVGKLPGVGGKTEAKLQRLGVATGLDLKQQSQALLSQQFGKFGLRLYHLAHGVDERPVGVVRERKSVSVEHTFAEDLPDYTTCQQQLPALIDRLRQRAAQHLKQRNIAGAVVKVKFADFTQTTAEHQVTRPTLQCYESLLREAYGRGGKPVRLLGVGIRLLSGTHSTTEQLDLWQDDENTYI